MTGPEVASLVASVVSVVLALVAIALALLVYRWSSEMANRTDRAADRIEQAVDAMRTESFSMISDTFSDFRRHAFSGDSLSEDRDRTVTGQIDAVKADFNVRVLEILQRQDIADSTMTEVRDQVSKLGESAIEQSRGIDVQARSEALRSSILRVLSEHPVLRGSEFFRILDRQTGPYMKNKDLLPMLDLMISQDAIVYHDGKFRLPNDKDRGPMAGPPTLRSEP